MLPLGTRAPAFSLPEPATGRTVSLDEVRGGAGFVVVFLSNHCPFVKHLAHELATFASEYRERGIAVVGIGANDARNYPQDGPERIAAEVELRGYTFPYLFDESQDVAKAYRAACTPDCFLFDRSGDLVYRGQFDDSRPSLPLPVTGADLRAACDALLAGKALPAVQRPSVGCNIKWKEGEAPDYFG